jgi:hypothetical protein
VPNSLLHGRGHGAAQPPPAQNAESAPTAAEAAVAILFNKAGRRFFRLICVSNMGPFYTLSAEKIDSSFI